MPNKETLDEIFDEYLDSQWNGNMKEDVQTLIATSNKEVVTKFAEGLKSKAEQNWSLGFPQTVGKREIDAHLAAYNAPK